MYDGIFKDFNTIKTHCERNGEISFEESAVFELLENLFPMHGSEHSVQIVIEMLDAQRIRDCKDSSNEPKLDISHSDKSNDADSIIEVEVPHKIHPIVDLTNNSPESDDPLIVENQTNQNRKSDILENDLEVDLGDSSSGVSDNEFQGLNDPDILKHYEEDWNQTVEDMIRSADAPPLADYLAMLEQPDRSNLNQLEGDQSNSAIAEEREVPEMLEENNNDPNNNLDGGIFNEEPADANNAVDNNTDRMDIMQDFSNLNSNDSLIEVTDPTPGCSKDTESKVNIRSNSKDGLPHTIVSQSTSPTPGCSKDYDDSNDFESSVIFDESIQNDAVCIQEIVPWANLETIYSILKKHSNSPSRKQLTLWDLMSEQSSDTNNTVNKRKHNSDDTCMIAKKSPKLEASDDVDESSLDLAPTLQLNNAACNESSNDSQSSRMSECNESSSEVTEKNQNERVSEDTESSKTLSLNRKDSSNSNNNSVDFSNQLTNNVNNHILMDEAANLMPANIKIENQYSDNSSDTKVPKLNHNHSLTFADRPVKKERNETVVSGSLNEHSVIQPVNNAVSKNTFFPLISKNSLNEHQSEVDSIKKDVEDIDDFFLNSEPFLKEGHHNTSHELTNPKSSVIDLIKPSKLVIQQTAPIQLEIKPTTTTSYIRPATFNYTNVNSDMERQKIIVRKDLGYENKRHPMSDNQANVARPTVVQPNDLMFRNTQLSLQQNKERSQQKQILSNYMGTPASPPTKNVVSSTIVRNGSHAPLPLKQVTSNVVRAAQFNGSKIPIGVIPIGASKKNDTSAIGQMINFKSIFVPSSSSSNKILTVSQQSGPQRLQPTATITSVSGNRFLTADQQPGLPRLQTTVPMITSSSGNKHVTITQQAGPLRPQPTATITSSMPLVNTVTEPSTSGINLDIPPSSVEVPDRTVYNKLRSIFPEVRKSYVKKICINPPNEANYINKDQVLNILIDHLLREGHDHLRPRQDDLQQQQQQQPIVSTLSIDEQYEYLLGIFPDADPTYLRDFVEKSCSSEQVLEEFIQQKLEKRDYPTKEQYLAKIKTTEQQKQYTTDFQVERFLELIPDPFKYFEDETRQCIYQPIATEFLKSFFNKNKVNTISRTYVKNKYNISLTAKALSTLGPDMKSRRMNSEMPTENIPLLQELAFVKNKQNIQNHINTLKNKEEQLFKELQEKNLLLTCQCCFNDECMPTKSSECNVGHVFCFECIIRGTESTLADGEAHVRCFTDCSSEFSLATLQNVLPPTQFSALLKKRQAAEVIAAGVDGLVSCPFCHFASIPPLEDKVFKCLNPECMKETCRQCKELNHIPLRCDEVLKTDKARHLIEEKMTEALLRTCYNCKRQFYKEDGCNKMKCNCGALMCYICNKPVRGYDHFNSQGGTNTHLCPLWSDDKRLNAEAVRKVAEDMKKVIQKTNPNLKIDMESLLPKLPPKTKGPHDDIPNANQLPEHVRRLAGAAP